jgi:hypothetical protein
VVVDVGGQRCEPVTHHDVVKPVCQISYILPIQVSGLTDKELADLGLETVDEVEAKISRVAVWQVCDEALKLVRVGLDRGGLTKVLNGLAGLVVRVRVSHMADECRGELVKSMEASAFLLSVWGAVTFGLKPGVSSSTEEGGSEAHGVGGVEVKAGEFQDITRTCDPWAYILGALAVEGLDDGSFNSRGKGASRSR